MTDVVNNGYRQPPGDSERRAAPSDELVSDETLRTKRESSIAVKFVDGSELSVEQSSEVVLSDYLFDPQSASATGVINLNTGLFHFSSNNVPENGLVLKTPVATIGIRGTEFLVHVDGDDATVIDILDGQVEVKPLHGGKPITCGGGQSILVADARSDAMCGDIGSFATAAAAPAPQQDPDRGNNGKDHQTQSADKNTSGGHSNPGGGNPGGGDPGGGDPGGGDPGGGDPGGGGGDPGGPPADKGNHSGLGDGSNPGKGHDKGNGNSGNKNNGGTNNPGGKNH
ncbi:MAG: FecR family protein [Dongiaceae bacterium]